MDLSRQSMNKRSPRTTSSSILHFDIGVMLSLVNARERADHRHPRGYQKTVAHFAIVELGRTTAHIGSIAMGATSEAVSTTIILRSHHMTVIREMYRGDLYLGWET